MFLKLLILLLSSVLNFLRGYHWRPLCIALMAIMFGAYFAIHLHIWWLLFAVGIPLGICLGLHDGNRGAWCSIDALGVSFALLVTGHLFWLWFVLYCGGNYLVGWIGNNKLKLPQVIIDPLTGLALAVIVLLV